MGTVALSLVPPPSSPHAIWKSLTTELNTWYHLPDTEALLISLCANCSHFYPGEPPVWIMALGPSGSGKTEILIQANRVIPTSRIIGSLTPAAFLSSFNGGRQQNSLLPPSGGASIWLAKDFTTICSLRHESLKEVASRLREVADGEIFSDTGVGPTKGWKGKVTLLAVATPEVEDHWGAMRVMGERFLQLRWRSAVDPSDRKMVMEKARRQLGQRDLIHSRTGDLVTRLCNLRDIEDSDPPPRAAMDLLDETADLVALLRTGVERDAYLSSRPILRIGTTELPTRIASGLAQIVRTHQGIFHHPPVAESLALAERLASNSVPRERSALLRWVPRDSLGIEYRELLESSRIPRTTLNRLLEDLIELGVLDRNTGTASEWGSKLAAFDPEFRARLDRSVLNF